MADLDDDEKWLAHKYFPMLIAESESSPEEDALEHVAEVATIFTKTALRQVFNFCTPIVLADLLMIIFRCLPTEIYSDQSIQACYCPGANGTTTASPSCNLTS
ncbi:hypothetical protein H6G97_24575 [Nostoc flagelliforme FACHB-838]|uniref:Transposase n=1 Tax=Nostoc flagelliforme FACHB-838 TaxID=2692904 RepID=A0ABR8DUP4_9NOSO|nr:hypothetical protein [Nostoc flagelliforme]MBD2532587.1 hypothetical protein [Nostoc flagelliforme FACHB-838]